MKKKFIIGLAILVAIISTSAVGFAVASGAMKKEEKPSDYKIGITYEKALESDKPMVGLLYVDWCGYCLRFMPKFKTVSKLYKDDYNFVMLNGEAQENQALVDEVAITGLPTLYIFDPKYDNRVHITNGIYMDLKKLRVELDRFLKVRAKLDAADSCTTQ